MKRALFLFVLGMFALTACTNKMVINSQQVIYVDQKASGKNDGSSWANAYKDLQDALKNSNSGTQIWVSEGIYKPTPGTDREISFQMVEGTRMYGGFTGKEVSLNQRDWENNQSILSGDIGKLSDNSDNSRTVVFGADNAVLDGFIIEKGNAIVGAHKPPGPPPGKDGKPRTHISPDEIVMQAKDVGAGLKNFKAAPMVCNTIIRNNKAGKGGGVYNMTNKGRAPFENDSVPVFINVTIENNYAFGPWRRNG